MSSLQVGQGTWWIAAALALLPAPVAAQVWVADAAAGASQYDAVAGEVGSASAMLGVRRDGPRWLSLYGGVPLDSAGIPWLAAGAGGRWSRWAEQVEYGLQLSAVGFGYHLDGLDANGGGATATALPFVAYIGSGVRLEGRTGALHHESYFDGDRTGRTLLEGALRASRHLPSGVSLQAEGRVLRGSEATYPFAGGAVQLTRGTASAWVRGGRWFADELADSEWGVGARLSLPARFAVRVAYERDADDPLYWNGARRSWSLGVSRTLGSARGAALPLPVPQAYHIPAGSVVLRVSKEEAPEGASVAGDFTGWESVAMTPTGDGWEARFELSPGVYRFAFQRDDGSWFLPRSVINRVDDGFGGMNGVLVVAES